MKTEGKKKKNPVDKPMKEIGRILKTIRINDGLVQEDVSEESMLCRSLISRAERGGNITLKSLLKILGAYDYNLKSFGFLIEDGSIF